MSFPGQGTLNNLFSHMRIEPPEQHLNELGIQQISRHVHAQIFGNKKHDLSSSGLPSPVSPSPDQIDLSRAHLTRHELYGKNTDSNPPICFDVPGLQGQSLDEHFWKLGMEAADPYLDLAKKFSELSVPPPPEKWEEQSGWTKYNLDGTCEKVDAPNEEMVVFDVEVLYKISPFAVMACAVSPTAWYAWISPWILGEDESDRQLIPLGNPDERRIIVGHNVGYDRARVAEEYSLKQSKFSFLDTMSLHVASNGMCSRQRPTWLKHRKLQKLREESSPEIARLLEPEEEEEKWIDHSSINSLLEVAKFHCNVDIDKGLRDKFGTLDREGCRRELQELLGYCAADVEVTHKVYKKVLPGFLKVCPHPVSFAALRHLSSVMLPVNKSWEKYIKNADEMYMELSDNITKRLTELAQEALKTNENGLKAKALRSEGRALKTGGKVLGAKGKALEVEDKALEVEDKTLEADEVSEAIKEDPWLRQLDWSGQAIKINRDGSQRQGQKQPGKPRWYKDLFPTSKSAEPHLSVRTRISPLLLKLSWDKRPLIWSNKFGWIFRVPNEEEGTYKDSPVVKCDMKEEPNPSLNGDVDAVFFKLPHKDGPTARCTAPLAKSYLKYFEEGILTSEYPLAREALEMNASCSYWISARERIKGQMVVYESDRTIVPEKGGVEVKEGEIKERAKDGSQEIGIILPQLIPMGTITRRAVESTWLTASNAKKNRVGSELKAMVIAPPGYVFVGADVDSQELWIASLVGDAQFKLHGGNALGFMTLEGTRSAGTDLHSKTAKILGISRNNAKIFNYGRIYGAGVKFASTILKQFNPKLSEAEALKISENLYRETKGRKTSKKQLCDRPFWRGGTESFVFNKLEEFADQDEPRTPVLGAGITEALRRELLSKNGFMCSRINWAIQSSGVDYLHLLIISMDHLISRFNLNARLAITVHDEIRYLVKLEDRYKTAMALQVANLWTRAMFSQQMGIEDLPQVIFSHICYFYLVQ